MKEAKVWSVLLSVLLLSLCVGGVLIFGASATAETTWYVDGENYPTIKAALDAAYEKSGEWGSGESLVIFVDSSFLASEHANQDAQGNSYGDLLFGVHTIFRADNTRLPITIQTKDGNRDHFTINSLGSGSFAFTNSYTFKDLTFPIDTTATSQDGLIIYAGSGQVRFENVATGKGANYYRARFAGDNFTKEAFVGWTQEHIDANTENGLITTSITLGNNVIHDRVSLAGGGAAAWFDGSTWQGDASVLVTPQMTKTELVIDGATVGVMTSRYGNGNAVAESVLRVESGTMTCGVYGTGSVGSTYTGDMSVEIHGGDIGTYSGQMGDVSVALFTTTTAHTVTGDVNLTITGGTFTKLINIDTAPAADKVGGDLNINISGGDFQATGHGLYFSTSGTLEVEGDANLNISGGTFQGQLFSYAFYGNAAPSNAVVKGNWTTNISGGVFNGGEGLTVAPHADIRGNITANISGGTFNCAFRGAPKTKNTIPLFTLNVKPHASGDATRDPVFSNSNANNVSHFYPFWFARAEQFDLQISGGTFKGNVIAGFTGTSGFSAGEEPSVGSMTTTISGNPKFQGPATCFGTNFSGTEKVAITVEGSPSVPNLNVAYGAGVSVGEVAIHIKGNPTMTSLDMFHQGTCTGNYSLTIDGGTYGTSTNNALVFGTKAAATIEGDVTLNINGGTFQGQLFSYGVYGNATYDRDDVVKGDWTTNVTGGTFAASGNEGLTVAPMADLQGVITANISGGTFDTIFKGVPMTKNAIQEFTFNVEANAKDAALNPVFGGPVYLTQYGRVNKLNLNISSGTFKANMIAAYTTTSGFDATMMPFAKEINSTVSGSPKFQGAATCFGTGLAGTDKVTLTLRDSAPVPSAGYNALYSKSLSIGEFVLNIEDNRTLAGFSVVDQGTVTGKVTTNISGSPIFNGKFEVVEAGVTIGSAETNITGNPAFKAVFSGAGVGTVNGDVELNIHGGTFTGATAVSGPYNGGKVGGNLTVNITGGNFATSNIAFGPMYTGGAETEISGNYVINISGGTFTRQLHTTASYGTIGGEITTKITGGIFQNTVSLGTKTAISGGTFRKEVLRTQCDTLTLGEEGKICNLQIYADTSFQADAVLGSVILEQQEQWKSGVVYLSVPKEARNQVTVAISASAFGSLNLREEGNTVQWIGAEYFNVVEYFVTDAPEDDTHFLSVEKALEAAKNRGGWGGTQSLLIHLEKDVQAQVEEGVLFKAPTVFRANKTKLPITLCGNVTLTVSQDAACANDYRFEKINLKLTNSARFFAGCGNVVFSDMTIDAATNGIFCADNFTAAVFRGWTTTHLDALKDPDGKLASSLTVGEGVCYGVDQSFVAVGFSYASDFTTVQAAQEAKYNFASSAGVDVRPAFTRAKLVINTGSDDGATHPAAFSQDADAEIGIVVARQGNSPVGDAVVEMQSGIVRRILGTKNANITCVGDITILVTGGTLTNTPTYAIRGVGNYGYKNVLIGNLSITVDEKNGYHTNIPGFIQGVYNSGTITGTGSFTMNGGYVNQFHGVQAMGGAFNTVTGGEISLFTGTQSAGKDYRNNGNTPFQVVVTNTVTGGTFNNFVAGCYSAARVDHIYNFISGTPDINYYYGGGGYVTGSTVGVAENTFDLAEGARIGLLNCGTRMGGDTTRVDSIINYVKGGTFPSFNAGSYNNGVTGKVKNVITGGTFTIDFYACNVAVDSIETIISGGDFQKNVYLGTSTGKAGSVKSVITGGTFRKEILRTPSDTLTLGEEGKACTIKVYADCLIQADSVLGSVTLEQQKQWKSGGIYLIAPREDVAKVNVTSAPGVAGSLDLKEEGDGTVRWIGCAFYGVRLALQDKIVVKLYFSKLAVQMWGDGWHITVDCPELGISQRATEKDLLIDEENGDYYYALPPVAASNFHRIFEIGINDSRWVDLSVMEVCKVGRRNHQGNDTLGLVRLYESIYDLGLQACKTFHNDSFAEENLPLGEGYQGSLGTKTPVVSGTSEKLKLKGATLELANSIGVRIYGEYTGALALEKLTVWLDGVKLNSHYYELEAVDPATESGNFSILLRVKASRFTNEMRVEIRGESGESCAVSGVSVVSVANMNNDQPELIDALLSYVEATVGYIRGTQELVSWEKINSFPVANDQMTTDELRALIVDFFHFSQTFPWVPSQDYYEVVNKKPVSLTGGVVYGGLPYVAIGSGNVYRFMDFYNPHTGRVDIPQAFENHRYFGNQCSSGAFAAWGRVINSAAYSTTEYMVPKNGFIKLGNYVYDETLTDFKTNVYTSHITQANGRQVMYESYALLQPADGLVHWTPKLAGHVIMSTSKAVVVRNPDGTINGDESYVTITEQASIDTLEQALASLDWKASFSYLYDNYYLPFTFAELQGTDPVEKSVTTFSHTGETITVEQLKTAVVESNYAISDVYVTAKDSYGNEVYTKAVRPIYVDYRSLSVAEVAQDFDSFYADGDYTLQVSVQLYTGERPVVYTGKLVR